MPVSYANLVTLCRLLLFFAFAGALISGQHAATLIFFLIAWALDGIDGYLARYFKQASVFGSYFDKVVDRVLLIGAVLLLIATRLVTPWAVLLLTKDIVALPALVKRARSPHNTIDVGWTGKFMTLVQGASIVWLLLELPHATALISLVAVLGALVGGNYLLKTYQVTPKLSTGV